MSAGLGTWELPSFAAKDMDAAVTLLDRYADQRIGLADASLVVLTQRYETRTIATLDRRHFTTLRRPAAVSSSFLEDADFSAPVG